MAMKWRAILAACVLGSALLLVFVWLPSTRGHVEGTVHFAGCGGAAPIYQPGQPPYQCTSILVPGAVVIAVPGPVARYVQDQAGHSIVVPSPALFVRTDARGRYKLDLPPGIYMVEASESGWVRVDTNGLRTPMPAAGSEFRGVRVIGGATAPLDLSISFNAA
jgi:hypothetical protein